MWKHEFIASSRCFSSCWPRIWHSTHPTETTMTQILTQFYIELADVNVSISVIKNVYEINANQLFIQRGAFICIVCKKRFGKLLWFLYIPRIQISLLVELVLAKINDLVSFCCIKRMSKSYKKIAQISFYTETKVA